jgi:hypothetical protein
MREKVPGEGLFFEECLSRGGRRWARLERRPHEVAANVYIVRERHGCLESLAAPPASPGGCATRYGVAVPCRAAAARRDAVPCRGAYARAMPCRCAARASPGEPREPPRLIPAASSEAALSCKSRTRRGSVQLRGPNKVPWSSAWPPRMATLKWLRAPCWPSPTPPDSRDPLLDILRSQT